MVETLSKNLICIRNMLYYVNVTSLSEVLIVLLKI